MEYMSYYDTVSLDDGTLIGLSSQRRYSGGVIGGTWAYCLKGILSLGSDAVTQARATQIYELQKGLHPTFYDSTAEYLHNAIFVRHATHGTFWAKTDTPYVKHYTGDNQAEIEWFMIRIGTQTDFQACYLVDGLDVETSDWSI